MERALATPLSRQGSALSILSEESVDPGIFFLLFFFPDIKHLAGLPEVHCPHLEASIMSFPQHVQKHIGGDGH
jgi:hypothetical protein